jgi:UDP-2,3-diacylglucosamine pyrophosphatase LpxH
LGKKKSAFIQANLRKVLEESLHFELPQTHRILILSDLHIGDGGKQDDFRPNSRLVHRVLQEHYWKKDYGLLLNGDIEELQKFSLTSIHQAYPEFFDLLKRFKDRGPFWKLAGNHDWDAWEAGDILNQGLLEGLRLGYQGQTLFVFHGHQGSATFLKYNNLVGWILRYLARPLGIKNYSYSYDSRKPFQLERQVYSFSQQQRIISCIGHTHRPLFESLSKEDSLRFELERRLRKYPKLKKEGQREKAAKIIGYLKNELDHLARKKRRKKEASPYLYNKSPYLMPCLFNSGCAIGKRSFTALEVVNGVLRLVHWYEKENKKDHWPLVKKGVFYDKNGLVGEVLNSDPLDYIFSRVSLLTEQPTTILPND